MDVKQTFASGQTLADISTQPLELLVETGLLLARERDLDVLLQATLDTGLKITGATYGAFFHTVTGGNGAPCPLIRVTGDSEAFPFKHHDAPLNEALFGGGIIRCADILPDAHFGPGTPFAPLTAGPRPTRSYYAIPVHTAHGGLLGGLVYGHLEPHKFLPPTEPLIEVLAAQAAIAIENTRLHERLAHDSVVVSSTDRITREKATTDLRLRQALDAAQLGTWTWNVETDLLDLDARAAELFHFNSAEPLQRSQLRNRIVVEEDRMLTIDKLQKSIDTGQPYHAEYRIRSEQGVQYWLAANGTPTRDAITGQVTGMIGTVQDITARKRQDDALRQSEKLAATGRLAATIAHEINNPLEAVTNLIYLVKTDPAIPPEAQHLLETADQELARVAAIAQQTLGFYRDTTRPVTVDLNELLKGVVSLFQRKLNYKKISCILDLSPDLRIFGLQGELRQVFSNLVVNAIDASLHGNILIRGRQTTQQGIKGISITICDQGTGVSPEAARKLFTPFFTTKAEIGTGLGLWVTRGIIEKQGGSIRFRSSIFPPSGTVFRVFLPQSVGNLQQDSTPPRFLQ